MINKLTIVLDNDGEQDALATIASEVQTKGHNQVSIVEHCLAGCEMTHVVDIDTEVLYAKQRHRIIDMAIFEFEEYEQTDVIVKNFGDLLTDEGHSLDKGDVAYAALFFDMIGEAIVDAEELAPEGVVKVISTILEPIN